MSGTVETYSHHTGEKNLRQLIIAKNAVDRKEALILLMIVC